MYPKLFHKFDGTNTRVTPITNNRISINNPNTKNESPIVVENESLEPICQPISTTSNFNPVAFTI